MFSINATKDAGQSNTCTQMSSEAVTEKIFIFIEGKG